MSRPPTRPLVQEPHDPYASRKRLAIELVLTSGALTYKDLEDGLLANGPEGVPELRALVINILLGGINGVPAEVMHAGLQNADLIEAADDTIWTTIALLAADFHSETDPDRRRI